MLDAAGATQADVDWATDALDCHNPRNAWGYFTAVIRERIATRILDDREKKAS